MNKFILPLLLIVIGITAIGVGQRRSDSIAGISETVGAKIANTWDGKARQPVQVLYYVGGGASIVAGLALATRKNTSA